MTIYDRWHKTHPRPGDMPCASHSTGRTPLYMTAEHMKGDRWQVRWRNDNGEQCKRNFPKRKGADPETCAEAFDAQRIADTARGDWIDPRLGRTPFADYAPVWMKSRLHKTGTSDTYELHLRNHIVPAFAGLGVASIRPTTVQQWVKDLQAVKGLAPATIETIYIIFASIMRGAVRDGYIRKTPCLDIRLPERTPTVVRLLDAAQVLALAAAIRPRYAVLVLAGAAAGLRQGEAFGLALDRIDLTADMITVNQQVIIVNRRPVLAPPKTTASIRDVPMARFLKAAIVKLADELALADDAVLCTAPRGRLLRRDWFNRTIWKPAIAAAKLPADTTFHDLRHTFASTALAEGVPISEVSRWLGHKSITTTVDLYGHLVPEATGRARDALDKAFGPHPNVP
jgi:integrase